MCEFKCEFKFLFMTELRDEGGIVLDCVILRGVSNFCPRYLDTWEGRILETLLNMMQYNTTTNYDLSAKTYNLINISARLLYITLIIVTIIYNNPLYKDNT